MEGCEPVPAQVAEPHADTSTLVMAPAGRATRLHGICFMGRLGFEGEHFPRQPLENCNGFAIIQPYPLNKPVMYLLKRMALGRLCCKGHESTQA